MGSRLELQDKLIELLGTNNVYYQPPESISMNYPAIRYKLSDIQNDHANNGVFKQTKGYEIIVIDPDPENEVIDKLSKLPLCRFNRHYEASNLNHDVFTLYY